MRNRQLWGAMLAIPLAFATPLAFAPPATATMLDDERAGLVYDAARNAEADVAAALARAASNQRMTLVVLGGNWCHDSRALGTWLTSPRFQRSLTSRYEIVFVDVGMRDRNLAIPARWNVTSLEGTPTVLIIGADGQLLNRDSAAGWRNAASRKRGDVLRYFERFTAAPAA